MSLADELLADLEEMEDERKNERDEDSELVNVKMEMDDGEEPGSSYHNVSGPRSLSLDQISKLMHSEKLTSVLEQIETYSQHTRSQEEMQANLHYCH